MADDGLRAMVSASMPQLLRELEEMVRIPSIAFPGAPAEPVERMARTTVDLLRSAGFITAASQEVPSGAPPIYAEVPGPRGAPTVMLYAHYDVQPAPESQGWSTDPWIPTWKDDGRLYGRGAADDKSGIAIHMGTLRAFGGQPPCTLKLIVEGMEETESNLADFVGSHPHMFDCDVFVVADMGNLRLGRPALTTTLRGEVSCIVTVRTLQHPLHSGVFGGPAPDALVALIRLLSKLHDDAGDVAVAGLTGAERPGATPEEPDLSDDEFRANADLADGVRLIGTGTIGSRLWCSPSISVIGLDTTTIAGSSNVLLAEAGAKLSMRIVPGSDPHAELATLTAFLHTNVPWGAQVEVTPVKTAPPFRCPTAGPGFAAARRAMAEAFGAGSVEVGSGGSIPLMSTLQEAAPGAEFILWGAEDMARSRIHASDESVDPAEIESMIVAQALLLQYLAAG